MSGGSSSSITTQAPSWQLPYQQYGQNQALSQYQNIPQLVAPFAPQQEQAINNISALANGSGGSPGSYDHSNPQISNDQSYLALRNGNSSPTMTATQGMSQTGQPMNPSSQPIQGPWINSAQNYIQNTLGGGVQQNPELNNLFQLGANQIQNQLGSQFAGAGRNVDESAGATAQALGNFASGLYGNAFNTEAGLQNSALYATPSILNSQLGLQNALFGAGQNVQNLAQQYIQAPQTSLNQFLSRVNGNLGQTQATPYNPFSGGLGGGLLGSALGNAIGGYANDTGSSGWGSLIGGGLGALLGAYG